MLNIANNTSNLMIELILKFVFQA